MQRLLHMTHSNSGKASTSTSKRYRSDALDNIHNHCIDVRNRTIYVHSEMDEEETGVDFRMAANFIKNLDYLNNVSDKNITVKFMSFGGCWNYGMSIFDAIKESRSPVTSISYAHARSMSSIMPQAARWRYIHKNCDFMVHYGTYADNGDFRAVISGLKFSEKQNQTMLDIYAERCVKGKYFKEREMDIKKTATFIKNKIDKLTDWWLTAEEAVYYGFMDKVV